MQIPSLSSEVEGVKEPRLAGGSPSSNTRSLLKGYSVSLSHKDQTQHSVFSWMFMHFYVRFRLFGSSIALKTLKQIHLMHLNLKQRSKPRNKHPNTANVSITYNMSSKAYFDPKNAVFGP